MRSVRYGTGVLLVAAALGTTEAQAAPSRVCAPIVNPYPNTRYEDADLNRIRAVGVGCGTARAVVRGAHRKALGMSVPTSGIRRFAWHGWRVTGDVRGSRDRYVATRGSKRVRWVF